MSEAVETASSPAEVVDLEVVAELVDVFRQHGIEPGRLEWGVIRHAASVITSCRRWQPG